MLSSQSQRTWQKWSEAAQDKAKARWDDAQRLATQGYSGPDWENLIRQRLAPLNDIQMLEYGDHLRVRRIEPHRLSPAGKSARDRLIENAEVKAEHLFAIGISPGVEAATDERGHGLLRFYDGRRLLCGSLSLLVFIDEKKKAPLSMNIQLSGVCPGRWQSLYLRYDLDAIQLGDGPAAHFNAHWHSGALPDASDAEELDPRLPSLPLSPDAVIDYLVMTYFPHGPEDILPRDVSKRVRQKLSAPLPELAARLRGKRESLGFEPKDFCESTGVRPGLLTDLEGGRRSARDTSLLAVHLLSVDLSCPPGWLAFGEEEPKPSP